MEKVLVAFDFDNTIVDGNSDIIIRRLLKGKAPEHKSFESWTLYMQNVFHLLHEDGAGQSDICNIIEALPPTNGILKLLHYLNRPDCEVIVISDSNSLFIETWLNAVKVTHIVNTVYTNPAYFDTDGLLNITMHHIQDWCDLCERNMCKGHVLKQHVEKRSKEGITFSRTAYVGDGKNDFCPSSKLSSSDLIFPRAGYSLDKILTKTTECGKAEVSASIHLWNSAEDILSVLYNYFPSSTGQ